MVERFNGRISDILQTHHFRSGEDLRTTLYRYVAMYNHKLPQSALGGKPPSRPCRRGSNPTPSSSIEDHIIVRDVTFTKTTFSSIGHLQPPIFKDKDNIASFRILN